MSPAPRISIVTPSFNQAPYLERTLLSVVGQDYPDLEYIVVDGGSTDGSAEVIRRHANSLSWWVSEPDGGQVDAINKGLARATGDIVAYLNSDDLYAPGALARVAEAFEKHPEADIVVGAIDVIDADGGPLWTHRGAIANLEEMIDIHHVWLRGRQWVQPEVFLRRGLWERVGPFDDRFHLAFDVHYWMRCFLAGARPVSIPEVLAAFRIHAEQKSSAGSRAAEEIRRALEEVLVCDSAIRPSTKRRLRSRISYSRYQAGLDDGGNPVPGRQGGLLSSLLSHPSWLLHVPGVRRRILNTLGSRLGLPSKAKPPNPKRKTMHAAVSGRFPEDHHA